MGGGAGARGAADLPTGAGEDAGDAADDACRAAVRSALAQTHERSTAASSSSSMAALERLRLYHRIMSFVTASYGV